MKNSDIFNVDKIFESHDHEHDDGNECQMCGGTGEGNTEHQACISCGGTGVEPRIDNEFDDFVEPDDYDRFDDPMTDYEERLNQHYEESIAEADMNRRGFLKGAGAAALGAAGIIPKVAKGQSIAGGEDDAREAATKAGNLFFNLSKGAHREVAQWVSNTVYTRVLRYSNLGGTHIDEATEVALNHAYGIVKNDFEQIYQTAEMNKAQGSERRGRFDSMLGQLAGTPGLVNKGRQEQMLAQGSLEFFDFGPIAEKFIKEYTRVLQIGFDLSKKENMQRESTEESIAEVSDQTLTNYLTKVDADSRKNKMDPTKRPAHKANKSVAGFSRAFNKLDSRKPQGVAEGVGGWSGPLYDPDLQKGKKKPKLSDVKVKFPKKPEEKKPQQGVAEGKDTTPPGSPAWKDGYKAGLKDTTNKKPVGSYAYCDGWKAAKKKQGVAEGLNFHGGFPDVDHMHGSRGINLPTAETKKYFTDKKQWERAVDEVNHSKYDDNSEYIGQTGRSTVTINNREWARWSDAQQKGYINMSVMSEQGAISEGLEEGSEQVYKVVAVDKSNALSKQVKLKVKASSIDEVFERLAISDWYPLEINGVEVINGKRLKQGVAEGSDQELVNRQASYWDQVAKEKKNKEREALKAKKAEHEKTPIGKAEKYWGKKGVAEAGNKPVEKSIGMGDTRTPRELKTQMRGASDEFVNFAGTKTGPFHSKVAKMQNKLAKSELRRRQQGVAEGPDYAKMFESKLMEFSSCGGAGGIASSMSVGNPKAGSLFGGSYTNPNNPFAKKATKKRTGKTIKR